ncbi:hypothetical protein C5E10_11680 [Pseudoclavibacter sp. RFBG4]|nr:hypothetical protein C5E10_11680 [Pseudoclavibacter sp. RFBG4]
MVQFWLVPKRIGDEPPDLFRCENREETTDRVVKSWRRLVVDSAGNGGRSQLMHSGYRSVALDQQMLFRQASERFPEFELSHSAGFRDFVDG